MALEFATMLADCLPSLEAVESSFYEALEKTGNRPGAGAAAPARGAAHARAGRAASARSRGRGSAGRAARLPEDGRAIEFSQSYYRGDTYDFVAELSTHVTPVTRMFREAAEAPAAVRAQLAQPRPVERWARTCAAWRRARS